LSNTVNDKPNSLYYSMAADDVVIVSEPLDKNRERWNAVPPGYVVMARAGRPVELAPFLSALPVAAE